MCGEEGETAPLWVFHGVRTWRGASANVCLSQHGVANDGHPSRHEAYQQSMCFQHRADILMRSIFITSTADSGNSFPSLCVCHLSDCLSLSNDAWFVFRVCLYLPASAALFYLCQFRRRDRGIMLSASRRDATRHPRQLLSNAGPLFQLTLFSWQHQTVYVLSAEVMSKQTPSDGKPNKKNYNFAKNQWKVKAAKAQVPTQLNPSLSNVWKL